MPIFEDLIVKGLGETGETVADEKFPRMWSGSWVERFL